MESEQEIEEIRQLLVRFVEDGPYFGSNDNCYNCGVFLWSKPNHSADCLWLKAKEKCKEWVPGAEPEVRK